MKKFTPLKIQIRTAGELDAVSRILKDAGCILGEYISEYLPEKEYFVEVNSVGTIVGHQHRWAFEKNDAPEVVLLIDSGVEYLVSKEKLLQDIENAKEN